MSKKKSEIEKKVAGTTRADRDEKPKTDPTLGVGELPTVPDHLDDKGIEYFLALYRHLESVKAFWKVDEYILGQAAYWLNMSDTYKKEAKKKGLIQEFSTGARQISPEFTVMDKAEKHIQAYFKLLGVGPSARQSINSFLNSGGSEEKDPITSLMNRMNTSRKAS